MKITKKHSDITSSVSWKAFEDFEYIIEEYMPPQGEGDSKLSQLVTAVNKLIYKWYNDGDVFDNRFGLTYTGNDLSCYANWLYKNVPESKDTLMKIKRCAFDGDYEDLIFELAATLLNDEIVGKYEDDKTVGSIYNCDGPFEVDYTLYDDDDEWEDYDEEEDY